MRKYIFLCLTIAIFSCNEDDNMSLNEETLAEYIELNNSLELADLIACAGGKEGGLFNIPNEPTSVFFYPIVNATDFRYFEAENVADSLDFSKYVLKDLDSEPVFNGYLWKFNNTAFTGEHIGIVTYKTPGKLHVCSPIRQKTNIKPTEVNPNLVTIIDNGINPTFNWEDGTIQENVIYFQVISDADGNLISGTYTIDKTFTFYDLNNVVLNITDTLSTPMLEPNQAYQFTMMAVSEDNWVNLLIQRSFMTD